MVFIFNNPNNLYQLLYNNYGSIYSNEDKKKLSIYLSFRTHSANNEYKWKLKKIESTIQLINHFVISLSTFKILVFFAYDMEEKKNIFIATYLPFYRIIKDDEVEHNKILIDLQKIKNSKLLLFTETIFPKSKILQMKNSNKFASIADVHNIDFLNIDEKNVSFIGCNFHLNLETNMNNTYALGYYRIHLILNNIVPCGQYKISKEFYFEENNNLYFVDNLENLGDIVNGEISYRCLNFDIETYSPKTSILNRDIIHKKNIITHIGFSLVDDDRHNRKLFCLINLDFLTLLNENFEIDEPTDKDIHIHDIIYENILNGYLVDSDYGKYDGINCKFLVTDDFDILKFINSFKNNEKTYLLMPEYDMIKFLCMLINSDYYHLILQYNGHNYDYPQILTRMEYLQNFYKIPVGVKFKTIMGHQYTLVLSTSEKKTLIETRCEFNGPISSIDIKNIITTYKKKYDVYSLENVAIQLFSKEGFSIPISNNVFKIILKDFDSEKKKNLMKEIITVTNFCRVQEIISKIIEYVIDNDEITITFSPIEDCEKFINKKVMLSLTKDGLNISQHDAYQKDNYIEIANYCITDSHLPHSIMEIISYGNIRTLTANFYIYRGSDVNQYKMGTNIMGIILKTSVEKKMFMEVNSIINDDKTGGGFVIEPTLKGTNDPCALLDFASLYPSIIKMLNISPDSLVKTFKFIDYQTLKLAWDISISKLNRDDFSVIPIFDKNIIHIFSKKTKDNKIFTSLLSQVITGMIEMRKNIRERIKIESDLSIKRILNILQVIVKEGNNSVYGTCGSKKYTIPITSTSVAESVPQIGAYSIIFLYMLLNNSKIINSRLYFDLNFINKAQNIKNEIAKKKINFYLSLYKNLNYFTGLELHESIDLSLYSKYDFSKCNYVIEIIYGDTDSIILKYQNLDKVSNISNEVNLKNVVLISHVLTKYINILTNESLVIEFENIMVKTIIFSKKIYIRHQFEPDDEETMLMPSYKFPQIKKKYLGLSVNKRGYSKAHKTMMNLLISEIENNISNITHDKIVENIIKISVNFWSLWMEDFRADQINYNDFLISIKYTGKYKDESYYVRKKVLDFNSLPTTKNKIVPGDRYMYLLFIENQTLDFYEIVDDIRSKERIFNILSPPTKSEGRIAYEFYIYKFIKNSLTTLDSITDSRINTIYKNTLNYIKNKNKDVSIIYRKK